MWHWAKSLMIKGETMRKLGMYSFIGLLTFLVTNILLYVFREILQIPDGISVMIAYAIAALFHFWFHNNLTFKESRESLGNKLKGHMLVSILNYFIGTAVATEGIKFISDNSIVATALSTAVTYLLGFVMLNRFVYKLNTEREKKDDYC